MILFRSRRSRMALVACVVPSMTCVILSTDSVRPLRTDPSAVDIPLWMSEVVGVLVFAMMLSFESMTTASVLVPPTSIPIRRVSSIFMTTRGPVDSRRRSQTLEAQLLQGLFLTSKVRGLERRRRLPVGRIGCVQSQCRERCGYPEA